MTIGALAFLNPWLLAGLVALPVIYWLLRTVPPRPQRIAFPATRILVGLDNREKQPAKTPWWLMLIRLLAAAFVILALAEPVLNPNRETALKGTGPVVIVVDNGWSSGARWTQRTRLVDRLLAEAEGQNRPVAVVATAVAGKSPAVRIEAPNAARSTAAALQPQPFAPQREETVAALAQALVGQPSVSIVWLADGIDHDGHAGAFMDKIAGLATGGLTVVETPAGEEALGLAALISTGGQLKATVTRAGGTQRSGIVYAYSARGQRLGEGTFGLAAGETTAATAVELPLELRNQVSRMEIAGESSAGAVFLLDSRSQWHRVGMIAGGAQEEDQPLLGPLYYVQKALAPYSALVVPKDANVASGIEQMIAQNASVMVLADIGTLSGDLKTKVDDWVKKGGVLIRFSGPRLEKGGDDLLPVPLRIGGRTLGGALSWSSPQPLAPMPDDGLFAGLAVPPDVTVNRQVLADPARLGPDVKIWARLKDGTPLVTAARHGNGQLVLFHVTANTDWSNLSLSGLFVEMLRRLASLGHDGFKGSGEPTNTTTSTAAAAAQTDGSTMLIPNQVLDGYGTLRTPPPTVQPISMVQIGEAAPGPDHPPGFYGPQDGARALNIMGPNSTIKALPPLPSGATRLAFEGQAARPLKPELLIAALALLFADVVAVLVLQAGGVAGVVDLLRRAAVRASVLILIATGAGLALSGIKGDHAMAQPGPNRSAAAATKPAAAPDLEQALKATAKVTFGYVLTGDAATDEVSRAGLSGLNKVLIARTAVDPGEPLGINIDSEQIAFYPLIYWPVLPNPRALSDATLAKIDAYMKQGGMIIFDTRDYGQGMPGGVSIQSGDGTALQKLLGRLDIPRLEPVPEGHVLTKSFYLIRSFPGRFEGGQLWVEAGDQDGDQGGRKARHSDGVSSILVTSNDFASAWALDDRNRPIYPVVPGGELQREQAFRTGVNIVMYALTGNYKSDQVHVPALLERLGQ